MTPPRLPTARIPLPSGTDQYAALATWLDDEPAPIPRALDVGCGPGGDYTAALRDRVLHLAGIDPDPRVAEHPSLDEHRQMTAEAFAATAPEPFDVAVAVYVVEHVGDPASFLGAVRHCLREGGSFYGITPNLAHWFGLSALVTHRLGLDERLLRRLRGEALTEEYHHPIRYRLNTVRALARHGAAAGFRSLEVRHHDDPGVFEPYLPMRLRGAGRRWSDLVHRREWGTLYGTLIFRLRV